MLNIFSFILIVVCLIVILTILLKKFPALAILDVHSVPGEKEAKFKEQIIKQKVERDLAVWGGVVARVWLFVSRYLSNFLKNSQDQLKKIKLSYKNANKIPLVERKKMIKDLFVAYSDLIKKESFNEAEEKLVEIISLDQKNLSAFFKLASLYDEQKKWSEARQTYEHALKLARQYKKDDSIMEELTIQEIYFSLAWVEKEVGDIDAALENIREALDIEGNSPRYLDLILDLSIIKKDKELATASLERLAGVNPENNKIEEWRNIIDKL